jgi:serine/threonine protein kinase
LQLSFESGYFSSPCPAAFFRLGSLVPSLPHTFTRLECIEVVLVGYIGNGASGEVYNAILQISTASGAIQTCSVVAKFAFLPEKRKRLRREYNIYLHLQEKGVVEGIPAVLGLFQDLETRAVVIIMQDVGDYLHAPQHLSYDERGRERWHFSDDEKSVDLFPKRKLCTNLLNRFRQAFLDTLRNIHTAGVRHRDIRPENLTVTPGGTPFIIDFDKAILGSSEQARAKELDHLRVWTESGRYTGPQDVPSLEHHPDSWRTPSGSSSRNFCE